MTTPDGRTPPAPDQAEGEDAPGSPDDGRTPPAADQAEGDDPDA